MSIKTCLLYILYNPGKKRKRIIEGKMKKPRDGVKKKRKKNNTINISGEKKAAHLSIYVCSEEEPVSYNVYMHPTVCMCRGILHHADETARPYE